MNQTGRLQSTMIGTNVKPQELIHFTNVLVKIIHLVSLTIFCTFLKRWMFSTIHKDWHKCINLFKMNSFLCQITFANLYIFENFEKKNDSKEHAESVGSMNFCLFGVGVFCNLANGANINLVFFNLNLINYDHSCLICEHLHLWSINIKFGINRVRELW